MPIFGNETAWKTFSVGTAAIQATALSVSPGFASTSIGQTRLITPAFTPANATNQNLSWVSSNPSVATVSMAGLVNCIANGTTTITAQTQDGSNKTATTNISVAALAVRILANSGGASYTQAELQAAYDAQGGANAVDVVPQQVTDYANSLNINGYKAYLGHNTWWYVSLANGITAGSWVTFGGGGKSPFGANIIANGLVTYR